MCENPAVVCHLMPGVFEMDGTLRAEQQGTLQAGEGRGGVRRTGEVHEGHRASAAPAAATQHPQPSEARTAVPRLPRCAHTRTDTNPSVPVYADHFKMFARDNRVCISDKFLAPNYNFKNVKNFK